MLVDKFGNRVAGTKLFSIAGSGAIILGGYLSYMSYMFYVLS